MIAWLCGKIVCRRCIPWRPSISTSALEGFTRCCVTCVGSPFHKEQCCAKNEFIKILVAGADLLSHAQLRGVKGRCTREGDTYIGALADGVERLSFVGRGSQDDKKGLPCAYRLVHTDSHSLILSHTNTRTQPHTHTHTRTHIGTHRHRREAGAGTKIPSAKSEQ
eukprot:Gregarina_sp_Pseudo_9__153@NODE_1102_length_1876_cov_91_081655_g1030_i0_p3_GENE_NODE_1102_length_1876_cov_91_081655_g1030_i0NODE_1102_length_1876_cov_91_081655_g1030_i0_p3_ORF_typecomplete_len165_score0_31FYVE/PF01363_21/0_028_NODE_1102_length_1876_cov_91_081655_g1030_i07731267